MTLCSMGEGGVKPIMMIDDGRGELTHICIKKQFENVRGGM